MKMLATALVAFAAVASLAVPAQAASHAPSMRDTNWPCAGC